MLSINERCRLANLESVLLRTDQQYVARMERIADTLLPPQRGGPPPLDDVIARIRRINIDGRCAHRSAPPAPSLNRRIVGWIRRSWMQLLAVVWAGFLVVLGMGARTPSGMAVCMAAAAFMLALAGHRWMWRATRFIGRKPKRWIWAHFRARADTPWHQGAV